MFSILVGLLLAVGSNAVTAPSSECAHLIRYGVNEKYLPFLPSVSNACIAAYNTFNPTAFCVAECQSFYTLYSRCYSTDRANIMSSNLCGTYQDNSCLALNMGNYRSVISAVESNCSNTSGHTFCSPQCAASIAALEAALGCCAAEYVNNFKVVCGQRPIAPCSTVLNNGSVAAPSSECAYLLR